VAERVIPDAAPRPPGLAPGETAATGVGVDDGAPGRSDARYGSLVVAGILLALLMGALDQFVVLTALPNILVDFGQVPSSGTSVVTAYIITSTVAIPIFGKLSDLWSRRNVFLVGLAIFIIGSMLAGLSQSLPELIVFRSVQGFGSGGFFPVGIAIVAVTFPPATRARITGFLSGVFGIATVAGPLLGSAIVTNLSWRWVFYVNLPIGIIGAIVLLLSLGPLHPTVRRPFDLPGAALLVSWVGSLEYALLQVTNSGWAWTDPRVLGLLAAAVLLVIVFVLWELRGSKEPLVPLRLLSNRIVAVSGTTTFLVGCVFFPVATFLSLLVPLGFSHPGVDATDVVRDVLYALVLPVVFGAAIGGQLLTRISYRTQVLAGVLIALLGVVLLGRLTAGTPVWSFSFVILPTGGVVLPLIPLGFGIGLTFPVFLLAVQNEVPAKDVGEASGLVQFLQSLGGSIALSVLGSLVSSRLNGLDPSPSPVCQSAAAGTQPACIPYLLQLPSSAVSAYDYAFLVMIGLLVASLFVALFFRGQFLRKPHVVAQIPPPRGSETLAPVEGPEGP
jgi:EmrB/QacA subfamily drug resistance transporter